MSVQRVVCLTSRYHVSYSSTVVLLNPQIGFCQRCQSPEVLLCSKLLVLELIKTISFFTGNLPASGDNCGLAPEQRGRRGSAGTSNRSGTGEEGGFRRGKGEEEEKQAQQEERGEQGGAGRQRRGGRQQRRQVSQRSCLLALLCSLSFLLLWWQKLGLEKVGWVVSTCIIPRPHFCPQLLWLFILKLSFEHKREFLLEFRNSSGRYFFPQCPNTRRATGGDNQVSSVFWICCLCMLYTSCPFPTVVEYIHFLWATDFLWCAWFSLALFCVCVCACACMCMCFFHCGWMHPVSLGYWPFMVCLVFTCPLSFFYVCVCVHAYMCVCFFYWWMHPFSLGCWLFMVCLVFTFPLAFFCVCQMYQLSSWYKLDPTCMSCPADAS